MTDTEKAALERRIYDRCLVRVGQLEAEKAVLERRIDELCAEVERLHADQAHWELGNCPSCPNIADLQEALEQNAKLQELLDYMMPIALYAASDQERDRMRELGIEGGDNGMEA